jgi:hypothetical protein
MDNSNEPKMVEDRKDVQIDSIEVEDLIKVLDRLKEEGYTHIEVEDGPELYHSAYAVRERLETSEEIQVRLKQESWLEEREKAEYERLRAKYGNVD